MSEPVADTSVRNVAGESVRDGQSRYGVRYWVAMTGLFAGWVAGLWTGYMIKGIWGDFLGW
jgi:hypothetical protein